MSLEQQIAQYIEAELIQPLKTEIKELKAELNRRLPTSDAWMDIKEAALVMNLHYDTLRGLIHNGKLQEGKEWRRKPKCKKGYQIEREFAENYTTKKAA